MRMKRRTLFWRIIPLVLVALIISSQFVYWGKKTDCPRDEMCSQISRRYYPVRHWFWSGIFPFEGGFISDPHFLSSKSMPFPDSLGKILDSRDSEFQVMDINPFFNDYSSEILLLVHSGGNQFEYSLDFPKKRRVQAVISSPALPDARVFPYRGELAILVDFFGPAKGIYLLQPPLKSGVKLHLIPVGSSEFEEIAKEFKFTAQDGMVKQQFCETLPFASFYEKYAASCGWPAKDYANNSTVYDYDSFWLKG